MVTFSLVSASVEPAHTLIVAELPELSAPSSFPRSTGQSYPITHQTNCEPVDVTFDTIRNGPNVPDTRTAALVG